MEVKAHHIAATIVAVHISKFHSLRGVVCLSDKADKGKHIFFDVDKPRALDHGTTPSDQDPEVVLERAIIDLAGHEAEEIYYIVNHLSDHGRRVSDQRFMDDATLGVGDLGVKRSDIVRMTLELVSRNWFAVRDLARLLLLTENGTLDCAAAIQRLEKVYGHQTAVS